jgi:hypothetical protein
MSGLDRPLPASYWVEPGRFLAGEYPGSFDKVNARRRVDAFLQAGFTSFIDLTKPNELTPYDPVLRELADAYHISVLYTRLTIPDFGIPSAERMRTILDTIDASLAKGQKLYVHCWGGVGRTGTTVGCYLVRRGFTGEQALTQIAEWWREMPRILNYPRSPETEEQVQFVLNWDESSFWPSKGLSEA